MLAVGEVLGYIAPTSGRAADLDRVLARIAGALRIGGLLLFDLATPRGAPAAAERTWTEGEGWAVIVDVSRTGDELRRRIVTFRDRGGGRFRRGEELHRRRLHRPAGVLGALRQLALGIGAPLLAVAVWATFGSPRARLPATGAWRLLLERLFFGSAAAALAAADQPALAIVFALAVAGNIALLRALGTDADARERAWRA